MEKLVELCLEVTNHCVLRCLHCSTDCPDSKEKLEVLAYDAIKMIIGEFQKLGGTIFEISGGEPTLHPYLIEIITLAKEKTLETRLYTCGVADRKGCVPLSTELLERLSLAGLDKIIFNLQGHISEIHDSITATQGSFKALIESIRLAKNYGFWVGAHFVPMKPNMRSFEEVLKLSIRLGIDEIALLRFVPQGRGEINKPRLKLSSIEMWEFLNTVSKMMRKYSDRITIRTGCPFDFLGFIEKTVTPSKCKAGISTCSITPEGDVIPCPGFKHSQEFVAGNIRETDLSTIWKEAEIFKQLRQITYKDILVCSKCDMSEVCKGRCHAQRVKHYNDLFVGPDPDCIIQLLKKARPKDRAKFYRSRTSKIYELSIP